jgi:hypothetical protein
MEPMSCRKLQSLLTLLAGRITLFFLLTLSALWTRSALAQLPPQTGLPPAPHLQLLHELQTPGLVSTLALSSDRTAADIAAVSAASARANACGRAAILEASDACYSGNSDVKKALYQVTSEELEMRGQALRVAVQSIYRRLISSGEMREGLEVTDTVLPYLPTGISFDEAEAVLRNAGFVVERRPNVNGPQRPNRARDWYAVISHLSLPAPSFGVKIALYILLLPERPGDYRSVSKVSATFYISAL